MSTYSGRESELLNTQSPEAAPAASSSLRSGPAEQPSVITRHTIFGHTELGEGFPAPITSLYIHKKTGIYRAAPLWPSTVPDNISGYHRDAYLTEVMSESLKENSSWEVLAVDRKDVDVSKVLAALEEEADRVTSIIKTLRVGRDTRSEDRWVLGSAGRKRPVQHTIDDKQCSDAAATLTDSRAARYLAKPTVLYVLSHMASHVGQGTEPTISNKPTMKAIIKRALDLDAKLWAPFIPNYQQTVSKDDTDFVRKERSNGTNIQSVLQTMIHSRIRRHEDMVKSSSYHPHQWTTVSRTPLSTSHRGHCTNETSDNSQLIADLTAGIWELRPDASKSSTTSLVAGEPGRKLQGGIQKKKRR